MAGENIPIYHVKYDTMLSTGCNAIIATQDKSKTKGLLEKAIEGDESGGICRIFRTDLAASLKIWEVKRTGYNSDKEGVIYFR